MVFTSYNLRTCGGRSPAPRSAHMYICVLRGIPDESHAWPMLCHIRWVSFVAPEAGPNSGDYAGKGTGIHKVAVQGKGSLAEACWAPRDLKALPRLRRCPSAMGNPDTPLPAAAPSEAALRLRRWSALIG